MHAVHNVTGALKLELDKERSANANATLMYAAQVVCAGCYLCGPIIPSTLIGLAVEEVAVVLADE
jgi:hypothetical protein